MSKTTLTLAEVAAIIGKTPATLRYDMCRHPERVPAHFKLPGSRTPLWLVATVEQFLAAQARRYGAEPK